MDRRFYDPEGQRRRSCEIHRLVARYTSPKFDPEGNYAPPADEARYRMDPLGIREYMWACLSFLDSGDPGNIEKANRILRRTAPSFGGSFGLIAAVHMLKSYPDRIDKDNIAALKEDISRHCTAMLSPHIAYSGINDNFPSMDSSICLIGGGLIGHTEGYAKGVLLLNQFKDLLTRRGYPSEYNSPTYSAISVQAMADIAEYAADPEIRTLALQLEERLYIDILGHFHSLIGNMAPPYSRTYVNDNCAHANIIMYLYHILFGDRLPVSLNKTLLSSPTGAPGEVYLHSIDQMLFECSLHACTTYHLPRYLAEVALCKTFPCEISGTTECRARRDTIVGNDRFLFPGSSGKVYTYMAKNYALGTATKDFSTGMQTNSFGILYRRGEVKEQADVGTVFSRYILNEADPNKDNKLGGKVPDSSYEMFIDCGRKLCMQKKNTAVAVYRPKHWASRGVTSMKLSLILPAHYGVPEQILLGTSPVDMSGPDGVKAQSVNPCSVIVKDGDVYMGFRPLSLTDHGRKAAVKVEKRGSFVLLSFYNYEGEEKEIDCNEVIMTANGVLCEVRQSGEIGSVSEMQELLDSAEILDEKLWFDGYNTERHVKIVTPSASFECTYCPETESVKSLLVDGEMMETPILSVPGIDLKEIPFYTPSWEKIRNL